MLLSHGPGLGDVLYSLAVIKHLKALHSEEDFILGLRGPIHYLRMYETAKSFLQSQSYLSGVKLLAKHDMGDYDLDTFRRVEHFGKENIVSTHFRAIGFSPPPPFEPWLTAEKNEVAPIVVHRTMRYRSNVDYTFLARFSSQAIVVGHLNDVKPFASKLKCYPTKTFAELAAIVNGCKVFIGNQSSPLAAAVGLGKARLYERYLPMDDCSYPHIGSEANLTSDAEENAAKLLEILARNVT